jgi:hypothetical protein
MAQLAGSSVAGPPPAPAAAAPGGSGAPRPDLGPAPPGQPWARLQVDPAEAARYQRVDDQQGDYNIWYGKYSGNQSRVRDRAETRCQRADAGRTRADLFYPDAVVCIFFARGYATKHRAVIEMRANTRTQNSNHVCICNEITGVSLCVCVCVSGIVPMAHIVPCYTGFRRRLTKHGCGRRMTFLVANGI